MAKTFEPWTPEIEDILLIEGTAQDICEIDPRVETNHSAGQLPVPPNPPPPESWEYWKTQRIPAKASQLAVAMLHNPVKYPMGAFVRIFVDGQLIGARVEWHNLQGATGKKGCFRGVNLLYKAPATPEEAA
jgi:hypothetical protein